jgi:two-component system, NarL family, nitrate/nitrite response regulator NarL
MAFDLLILSDIRFVRDGLAEVLARDGTFQIAGVAADIEQACALVKSVPLRIILVDTSLPHGIAAVDTLRRHAAEVKVVAFALTETEADVIAWAQAGISGYIPRNTPVTALVSLLSSILHGEQVCPTRIASGMLRWIAQHSGNTVRVGTESTQTGLTTREREIASLMSAHLSNKEIARRLGISVATTKSHVHNILGKLGVRKRAEAAQHLQKQRAAAPESGPGPRIEAAQRRIYISPQPGAAPSDR